MSQILYLNQKQLMDPRLSTVLNRYNYDWARFNLITQLNHGHDSSYIRSGANPFPLNTALATQDNFAMPDYDPAFGLNFGEVTDLRLFQLRQTRFDRPWLVQWSGGIDSQVIVVSILKNLSPADRKNVVIACNRISIYENPRFFYDHIEPNFELMDSTYLNLNQDLLNQYYVIDGDPADQLYGGIASRSFLDSTILLKDWRQDPDHLLDLLTSRIDRPFAEWYYTSIKSNIESVSVPVANYYDFFWWIFFNASWISILLRPLHFQTTNSVDSIQSYFDSFIAWYNTVEYQQWSMVNRLGIKYGANIGQRKLASKQYIYEFDQDEYYFRFKTKMESVSRNPSNHGGYFCILDNYTRLTLDRDLDQILQLLPKHISV